MEGVKLSKDPEFLTDLLMLRNNPDYLPQALPSWAFVMKQDGGAELTEAGLTCAEMAADLLNAKLAENYLERFAVFTSTHFGADECDYDSHTSIGAEMANPNHTFGPRGRR